ncbi:MULTISPECIES: glycosyltransferase [Niastella]|uniref:Glycosyltransferase n=1 Tax=Niastella soli TaxID=2821487 RepID=A0ABS3Z6H5_9BACT|nr:glycosyltransferase [Niastella soli]MBO9205285.1 glycosyltransferase [Niastella soli]
MKHLIFAVTNDLNYDQRMIRICTSLAEAGYSVTLIGRRGAKSPPLLNRPFRQKRLFCFLRTGKLSYIEYNLRLFFYLLFLKADGVCAIDLDTILPFYFISKLKGIPRVYDAHELFCEMKEVVTRPGVYKIWKWVERYTVPKFKHGYTVNDAIAKEFNKMYGVQYEVVRNVPVLRPLAIPAKPERYIIYQGAVNEGRSFETLIPAMQFVNARLIICGDGNFMSQANELVKEHGLADKVVFKGRVLPEELQQYTLKAWAGVTLFENNGMNNYHSLGNRFFDYMHAGLPQLCVKYPAYEEINNKYNIAVLTSDLRPESLAERLNELLDNKNLYYQLQQNCKQAREAINWQQEEKKLLAFYKNIF